MKKNIYKLGIGVGVFAVPLCTFAAGKTLRDIIAIITGYFSVAIGLTISLAVVTFVWNVYLYFFTEKDKTEAGKYVLFSTIGFFVILSLWGLVAILTNTFKLDNTQPSSIFGGGGGGGVNTIQTQTTPVSTYQVAPVNTAPLTGTYPDSFGNIHQMSGSGATQETPPGAGMYTDTYGHKVPMSDYTPPPNTAPMNQGQWTDKYGVVHYFPY